MKQISRIYHGLGLDSGVSQRLRKLPHSYHGLPVYPRNSNIVKIREGVLELLCLIMLSMGL